LQKILNLRPKSDLVVERELVSVEA
jgi:hypothetical protein